jgi:signal transduction histidine kinase/ligand-binding sensor domain-containing protein
MKKFDILILLTIFFTPVFSQEMGKPIMRFYSKDEYQANPQNWAITQDDRGVMYFANRDGILEYDGIEWRKIKVSNTTVIRSLAKDSCGRIYVGATGEFGYIAPDELGDMKYFSLSKELDTAYQYFNDVWQTIYTHDGIYFSSRKFLFRYNYHNSKKRDSLYTKNAFTIWESEKGFRKIHLANNTIFIRDSEYGLRYVQNDSLKLITNGKIFSTKNCFGGIMQFSKNKLLTFSYRYGFRILNTTVNIPLDSILLEYETGISSFLKENLIYNSIQLPNGNYVFGTVRGGTIITTNKFEPIQIIDETLGLFSNTCLYSYYSNGILWFATNDGIVSVELDSPFKTWNEKLGVLKSVYDIVRFKKRLYIATSNGVYYLDTLKFINSFSQNSFHRITGINEQCWDFSVIETVENNKKRQSLFLGASNGIYEIKNDKIINVISKQYTFTILNSKYFPNILFIGYDEGFSYMFKNNKTNKWKKNINFEDIQTNNIRTICEDNDSNIWFSDYKYIYKLKPDYEKDENSNIIFNKSKNLEKYDTITGPPDLNNIRIYNYKNKNTSLLLFATQKGLYTYNKKTNSFSPNSFFRHSLDSKSSSIKYFSQDSKGNAFFDGTSKFFLQNDNTFLIDTFAYKRVKEANYNLFYDEFTEQEWFCGVRTLISHDVNHKRNYYQKYSPLIRKVILASDSVIFNGTFYKIDSTNNEFFPVKEQSEHQKPIIDYKNNSVTIFFATPYFEKTEAITHSFKLENFDKKWSGWSDKNEKEYTNLPEGKYTFKLKAKNIYGIESETATYQFTVLSPWYRTWLAYSSYVVFSILLILLIVKLNTLRLVKAKKQLEEIVKERTNEILRQKEEIEAQADELLIANNTKDKFFSIVAHDLIGPFNALLGISKILYKNYDKYDSKKIRKLINILNQSAQNTFNFVVNLLQWARTQSDTIIFHPENLLINTIINENFSILGQQAKNKQISLNYENDNEIIVFADKNMVNTILRNLISNAVKYTEKGSVNVITERKKDFCQVTVQDTGIGLKREEINNLFKIDQNISTKGTAGEAGTGLGLILCKEFIEKLGGKIWVESEFGKGSKFIFTLPIINSFSTETNT